MFAQTKKLSSHPTLLGYILHDKHSLPQTEWYTVIYMIVCIKNKFLKLPECDVFKGLV